MLISHAFPSKYVSSADLQGRTASVSISHVEMEEVGVGEHKPVLYFQGKQKGMVLNKTNASMLVTLFGDNTDNWAGQPIELFSIHTEFQGKPVEGLRVRAAQQPSQPMPATPPEPVGPLNDDPLNDVLDDSVPF
jgi:hypothetical protein